jgi:hypothetical protein
MNKTLKRKNSLSSTLSPKSPKSPKSSKKTKKSSFSIIPSESESQHVIPSKIIPSPEGESEYEAYHSVFSWLTGTDEIYSELARNCGADNLYEIKKNSKEYEIFHNNKEYLNTIVIYSQNNNYHYVYKDKTGIVHDPYLYFQLNNTEGNCFLFALYLCYIFNIESLKLLINVDPLLEKNVKGKETFYTRVNPQNKQLAYKCFVYNDYQIIQWAIDHLMYPTLLQKYNDIWKELSKKQKKKHDIPIDENYTFDVYYEQFVRLARDMNNTYIMTWEQVENWDDVRQIDVYPEDNSGIENSSEINKKKYKLNNDSLTNNKLSLW